MRSTHTFHQKSTPPKSPLPPFQNCTKFPHNSTNHFDNHFDTPSKYPSINTNNKLSDNYKIHQNLPKSEKLHKISTRSPSKSTTINPKTHLSTKPLNKHRHTINQLRKYASTPNSLRNHTAHTKITP